MSSNHVKFNDQEDGAIHSQDKGITMNEDGFKTTKKRTFNLADDSDSDSDDQAPEEEGAAKTKEDIEKKLQVSEDAKKLEQQQLKEKRRKQNALFQEQQSVKKQKVVTSEDVIEPLEELPAELLKEVEQTEAAKPTHISFNQDSGIDNDSDDSDVESTIRKEATKKRKNQLKDLRRKTIKKGPVSVTLLSSSSQTRSMAPKKEVQITSTKDKWLRRKTLNRR
ncbi:similar to Saccharomyces cerevisiae YOR078W BUD21 Component of small ribosomal subunit (SSU) processosome that contains U3 snoRNA [Maudiozyma barnettii]|uniref:Similar to Saccharomyces cerevisiae YOR078W BUD21 Component of small ribosomal subunit (SSU) processosome that contains U3 snoRNA n=1 Tax=Maudiozyma barnettii TaxID=61262 RepID=A0A8H2ZJ78_9SACH|nr:Bud21p [Kazachstania barnettii]CAB4256262.1 similar to Saccharomyces cerevisiae YOR078W BUD21 Component of small ribosomal subunit (SSU) processosome that contains U3 snoRNA [Kazachstania barnettii]CAD1784871.1 similar to Saccharomyces cerevisiae YOR078W BUD21 Component of small ribosomal subunit (SSU) processosome that contains U3 snoRNA [Kazachstania barnettii]